jgi:hypothetical protein
MSARAPGPATGSGQPGGIADAFRGVLRSWFNLTSQERGAVLLVLGLFLLGLAVRWYRLGTAGETEPARESPPAAAARR